MGRTGACTFFLGEGVEEGKLSLGEGASGRGTRRVLGAPTVKEEIQGLLGRAGWWGVQQWVKDLALPRAVG